MNVIQIPAGIYNGWNFQPGNQYIGAGNGKTIIEFPENFPGASGCGKHIDFDDLGLKDLTIAGGGLFFDKPNGRNNNISILNVEFKTTLNECIKFTCGLTSSLIQGCYFTGPSFGIYGYGYKGLTIRCNEFDGLGAGMHIDAQGDDNSVNGDLLVELNWLHRIKGMGCEFQGAASNLIFQDNWFEHPNLSSVFASNNNSFAFSLILAKSRDIIIRRNYVLSLEKPDGTGDRIAFEIGGDNTQVYDNYVNTTNDSFTDNDGDGGYSVSVHDNLIVAAARGPAATFGGANRTFVAQNNGPQVKLTWDINRGHPNRIGGFVSGGGSTTNTDTTPTNIMKITAIPDASQKGLVNIAITDVPAAAKKLLVVVFSGNGEFETAIEVDASRTSFPLEIREGWDHKISAVALASNATSITPGNALASAATTITTPGDGTAIFPKPRTTVVTNSTDATVADLTTKLAAANNTIAAQAATIAADKIKFTKLSADAAAIAKDSAALTADAATA